MKASKQRRLKRPDGRDQSGLSDHPDLGHAQRHGQPQRLGRRQMRIRIRHQRHLRQNRVLRLAARVGHERRGGLGAISGLSANTTYHFRIVGDQRRRHEPRPDESSKRRRNRPDGHDQSGLSDHPDLGHAERDGQPQRLQRRQMRIRIRHQHLLRQNRACASLPGSGTSAVEVSAAISGLSANTTYHFRIVGDQRQRHEQRPRRKLQDAGGRKNRTDNDIDIAVRWRPVRFHDHRAGGGRGDR